MKKKSLLVIAIAIIVLGVSGCGSKEKDTLNMDDMLEIMDNKIDEGKTTEETTEEVTEEVTEETTEEVEIPENYYNHENVYFDLGDNWEYNTSQETTYVYENKNVNETFAICVQGNGMFSARDMQAAYKTVVVQTYGENYEETSYESGNYKWTVYKYGTDNNLNELICAEIYVYSNEDTTIYIEYAYEAANSSTGDIMGVIDSIIIKE